MKQINCLKLLHRNWHIFSVSFLVIKIFSLFYVIFKFLEFFYLRPDQQNCTKIKAWNTFAYCTFKCKIELLRWQKYNNISRVLQFSGQYLYVYVLWLAHDFQSIPMWTCCKVFLTWQFSNFSKKFLRYSVGVASFDLIFLMFLFV